MIIKPTEKEQCFINAYLEAIEFTELDSEVFELTHECLRECYIDCLAFFSRVDCYLSDKHIEQAGHDFWLTRNGHGAGFWGRPELYGTIYSNLFTEISTKFGMYEACFEPTII